MINEVLSMQSCSTVLFEFENIRYTHAYTLDFSTPIPLSVRDNWRFVLVKCGELTYTVDKNSFDIKPNTLIITPPGVVRSLTPKGSIIYDRHTFAVPEECINKDILGQISRDLCVLDVSDNPMILDIFDKITFYVSNLQPKEAASVLQSIGNELMANICIHTQDSRKPAEPMTNPMIVRLLDYINEHIREPLTVPRLSAEMSVSAGYLHQHFVKHMHMTPRQYIMEQKLRYVQQALKNNANPTEVCRQYGFRSYSTFYRNYQKVYGCSPSGSHRETPKREIKN